MPFDSDYSNPDVPHEVNVSEKSPARDFLRLAFGTCLLAATIVGGVFFTARFWAPLIPFRYEEKIGDALFRDREKTPPGDEAAERELGELANALAAKMNLPADMKLHVHLKDGDEPNAFATLGGNIVVFKGLLGKVRSENALAMVLAHEIGHVRHRDPIVSLGGGVAVALLFSAALDGSDGGALVGWAVGLTQMSFSRGQEERADRDALAALKSYYGYTDGADEFFEYIVREHPQSSRMPAFVSTHPTPPSRLRDIRASFDGAARPLTPLPKAIRAAATMSQ